MGVDSLSRNRYPTTVKPPSPTLQIGTHTIPNRVVVAPMAGVTDLPWRELCIELGAGMAVGEKKVVEIPCTEAYGEINPANRQAIPREQIPADIPLELGLTLQMQSPDGQHAMPVTVVELSDDEVTLDANHMLAGKDLTFAFEVISIKAA